MTNQHYYIPKSIFDAPIPLENERFKITDPSKKRYHHIPVYVPGTPINSQSTEQSCESFPDSPQGTEK